LGSINGVNFFVFFVSFAFIGLTSYAATASLTRPTRRSGRQVASAASSMNHCWPMRRPGSLPSRRSAERIRSYAGDIDVVELIRQDREEH
jgi:hypothetical protein